MKWLKRWMFPIYLMLVRKEAIVGLYYLSMSLANKEKHLNILKEDIFQTDWLLGLLSKNEQEVELVNKQEAETIIEKTGLPSQRRNQP